MGTRCGSWFQPVSRAELSEDVWLLVLGCGHTVWRRARRTWCGGAWWVSAPNRGAHCESCRAEQQFDEAVRAAESLALPAEERGPS